MSIKTEEQEILFMAGKIRLVTLLIIIIVKVKPNKAKVSHLRCTVIPQPNV